MSSLHRRSLLAFALAASGLLPLPLAASCSNSASVATGAGSGGAGGSSSSSSSTGVFVGAGGSFPDACAGPDSSAGGDGSTGCEGVDGGDSGVTYAQVTSILSNCTGEICHGVPTRDAMVDLPAYECCDGRFLVQPGNAAQSYLLDKVGGHDICEGAQMPFQGTPLSAADMLTLTAWVCEGAPGN